MRKLYRVINTLTYIVAHVTLAIMTITLMALPLLIAYTSDAGPLGWLAAAFVSLVFFSAIWLLTVGDPFDNAL